MRISQFAGGQAPQTPPGDSDFAGGNRRGATFFEEGDYALYRDLLAESAGKAGAEIWCYCLMPNHIHIIITPSDEDGLRRTFTETHRRQR